MSICKHVADHLRDEQPKTTRPQGQLGMWNSYTKQSRRGRDCSCAQPGYLYGGKRGERPHAQFLIFDKRGKIIAQCNSFLDRMSAVLSFGAGFQTGPVNRWSLTAFFLGLLQLFPLDSEKRQELCVLAENVSKSSSCFVWKRIKRSRGKMKIKRDAEFSGSTP